MRSRRSLWLVGFLVLCAQSAVADGVVDPDPNQKIHAMVQQLRVEPSELRRYELASDIAGVVHDTSDKAQLHDDTVDEIAGLLDDPSASYWAALALGQIGPAAKRAVPSLEAILEEERLKNEACLAQFRSPPPDVAPKSSAELDLSCVVHMGPPALSDIVCQALRGINETRHPTCEILERG